MKILSRLLLFFMFSCPLLAQDDVEVVNIENPAVQAYMADNTYETTDDYDVTVVADYADRERFGRDLDRPRGKWVEWSPIADVDSLTRVRILLSIYRDFHESTVHYPPNASVTSYQLVNLFPDRLYYYRAEHLQGDSLVAVLAQGHFRTEGQVRMIWVDGAHNVRDIGGWPTQFGVPIRYGALYRSGTMDRVTPTGSHEFVTNLGVGAELDLRAESRLTSSPLGKEVSFTRIITDSYTGAVSSRRHEYVSDLRWIIRQLRRGKAVNWHCAVGCDRCGTLTFLIEGLLGVGEADLCRDYELSTFRGHKRWRSHKGFRTMLPWIRNYGATDDLAECFYRYWRDGGVSEDDLDFFRSYMLDYQMP
ncbi:MAG: tyrosine-protein phosphatase [Bacteroidales bacterium]|nr:tyrosine-protein phosphatase [Candidatus Physcousia equi]